MIPPGVHLVYYSMTDRHGQGGMRNGFLHVFEERERMVRRWNPETEDFEPLSTAGTATAATVDVILIGRREEAEEQEEDLLRAYDPNLAAYPMRDKSYTVWQHLSDYITPSIARRVLPSGRHILDITQPDENNHDDVHAANESTGHGFTSLDVRRSYREGATGAERTKSMLDKSWLLESMLERHYHGDYKELLGEMQLAFILLLLGQNYSGLEQWKRIMYLVCGSEDALDRWGNTLFVDYLHALQYQLDECPHDFFYDLLSADNFIFVLLKMLFRNVAQQRATPQDDYPSTVAELVKQLAQFQSFLQKRFGWSPSLEELRAEAEIEEGEDAPVVVEL
ncbi:A1 cistron-splicing factor [Syncephalis pseudoplumigaleata]|uniref:A1 cistron-splicing factor n=1 Tax=Syncephalis pseudoplumigaleata TaxID=1712513 RepID=A0A4P9Z7G4_9FUNG|nr:A1 cistron-splicing factor [Syncephalis pseudoplumigaleata]|eukprot:RKP27841.1 A1 cistron-splicing factor [Syncephalis pseudoplumigaleata]